MSKELLILPDEKLALIKSEFTKMFPYLKLEFFCDVIENSTRLSKDKTLNPDLSIGSLKKGNSGNIVITKAMTVAEVEKVFHDNYKIRVKIYRKSGKLWLETALTTDWRLEYQNCQGEAISKLPV